MILSVQDVTVAFGGLVAVDGASFDVAEGTIIGLIGPNGAGKTTLFNAINGVYRPRGGRIMFAGEDITGLAPYQVARRGVARAHQVVRPLNDLSVRANATVGACFGREGLGLVEATKVADGVLAELGLAERPICRPESSMWRRRSVSSWRVRSPLGPGCCLPTKSLRVSIRKRSRTCWVCSDGSATRV